MIDIKSISKEIALRCASKNLLKVREISRGIFSVGYNQQKTTSSGDRNVINNHCNQQDLGENMSNVVVNTVSADGLAPFGARTYAGAAMINVGLYMYTRPMYKGL